MVTDLTAIHGDRFDTERCTQMAERTTSRSESHGMVNPTVLQLASGRAFDAGSAVTVIGSP